MNLAAIDLNLLVAFEALMEERHVTRAGQRIGLAQPSMSNALTRLRALFADELFVRTASGMRPTARAFALAQPVGEALGRIRGMLDLEPPFEPATARHRFTIAVTDYGDLVMVPEIVRAARREAPGVDLAIRPILRAEDSLASVQRGEIDALMGGHLPDASWMVRHRLFDERFVAIRDAGLAGPDAHLPAEDYVRLPHALFSSAGGDGVPGAVDAILAEAGLRRRIAITVPHVVAVPFAIAGTDLVATMAERIARRFAAAAGVAISPVPFAVPGFAVDLVYARRAMSSPAMRWFAELIVRTCGPM